MLVPAAEDGALPEKYNLPIFGIAVILAVVVNMIIDYNSIQNLKSLILKSKADIVSVNQMSESLIDKASRVSDKYLESEVGLYEKFAEARKGATKIRNSKDFKAVMVVAKYNAKIHSFPAVLLRNACKWDDVTIADNFSKDELVTDEELGI